MKNFIIVGSGAAGVAAAELLREKDGQASIQVITQDPGGYYSRPGLAYYLAGDVSREQLFPSSGAYFKRRNISLLNAEAIHIDPARHVLHLRGGRILPYDRLLLTPGATAIQAEVPGVELEGVVKLDDLADADEIMRLIRRGSSAVVVGGGITALELVEGFQRLVSGDFSYRLPRSLARDERDAIAFFFNAIAEEMERIVSEARANEARLNVAVSAISAALLQVVRGQAPTLQVPEPLALDAPWPDATRNGVPRADDSSFASRKDRRCDRRNR